MLLTVHSPFLFAVLGYPELTEFLIPVEAKNCCKDCYFYNKTNKGCEEPGYINCLDVRGAGLQANFKVSNIFSFEKVSDWGV